MFGKVRGTFTYSPPPLIVVYKDSLISHENVTDNHVTSAQKEKRFQNRKYSPPTYLVFALFNFCFAIVFEEALALLYLKCLR